MPDSAVAATQRQFTRLLEDASGDLDVRLSLFALETLPRAAEARRAMAGDYAPAARSRARSSTRLSSPAPNLAPPTCATSRSGTSSASSSIGRLKTPSRRCCSCLAAHAEVLRSDGVARRPLARKRAGVFSFDVVADHELVARTRTALPRPAFALERPRRGEARRKGLSRAGALAGMRRRPVRPQGAQPAGLPPGPSGIRGRHPGARAPPRLDALLARRGGAPPNPPANYYPPDVAAAVANFARRAMAAPEAALAAGFPVSALSLGDEAWRQAGAQLVHNWLGLVARRKAARSAATFAVARWGG